MIFFPDPTFIPNPTFIRGERVFDLLCVLNRYKRISKNDPTGWLPEKTLRIWVVISTSIYFLYMNVVVLSSTIYDLKIFNVYNLCYWGEKTEKSKFMPVFLFILLPFLILTILTVFLDVRCYQIAKKRKSIQSRQILNNIPLRTTIISSLACFVWFSITLVLGSSNKNLTPSVKFFLVFIHLLLLDAFRNPLMSLFSFKVNQINHHVDPEQAREQRRKKEIEDAKRRRENRNTYPNQQCQNLGGTDLVQDLSDLVTLLIAKDMVLHACLTSGYI